MPSDSSLSRLFALAGRHKPRVITACVLAATSTVFVILPYVLAYYAIVGYLSGESDAVWAGAIGASVSLLLRPVCFGFSTAIAHDAAFDTLHALRGRLLRKLTRLPLGFFTNRQVGSLKRIVNENVEVLEQFLSHQLPDMVSALVAPVITLIVLAVMDWRLGLAATGVIPVAWAANILIMKGHGDKISRYFQLLGKINASSVEYLQGIGTLKASGGGEAVFQRFEAQVNAFHAFARDWQDRWMAPWSLFSVATGASLLFVVPTGIWLIGIGSATPELLLFAILAATGIGAPMIRLMLYTEIFMRVEKAERSVDRLLKEQEIVQQTETRRTPEGYMICLKDVSFSQGKRAILSDVSFDIPQNAVTAIVGPSGAGKTSLVRLIARHWDATGGDIRIGGRNVRD